LTKYPISPQNDYNCSATIGPNYGQRGITYWAQNIGYYFSLAPNGGSNNISFTCDVPKCYQAPDVCNILYTFRIGGNSSKDDVGPLNIYLNGHLMGPHYHSRIQGHDVTEAIDLVPVNCAQGYCWFNDMGQNTLTFLNQDTQTTINIADFEISRSYGMCSVPYEDMGCCVSGNPCGKSPACNPGFTPGSGGSFDRNRNMLPCNRELTGGRSATYFSYSNGDNISPRSSVDFYFYANATASDYQMKDQCLFNFNRIAINQASSGNDVQFNILINGTYATTYYHSKVLNHDIWPTINLINYSSYNDKGSNTITLYNNDTTVHVYTDPGGQNIYRYYYTQPLS